MDENNPSPVLFNSGLYRLESITVDNRRPGMPNAGFVVYYNPHTSYGMLCRKCFKDLSDANKFINKLEAENI